MEMTQRDSDVPASSAVLSCSLFERSGQINRIRSAAEADGILLRACGTLDLYNDRSGNAFHELTEAPEDWSGTYVLSAEGHALLCDGSVGS